MKEENKELPELDDEEDELENEVWDSESLSRLSPLLPLIDSRLRLSSLDALLSVELSSFLRSRPTLG